MSPPDSIDRFAEMAVLAERVTLVLRESAPGIEANLSPDDLEIRTSPFSSRVPAFEVDVDLGNGESLELFVKTVADVEPDHPDKQNRELEPQLYARAFTTSHPVARVVGQSGVGSQGPPLILLERIPDWDLRYHEFDLWPRAAAELGRLHGSCAVRIDFLHSLDLLPRFDEEYHLAWLDRTVVAVQGVSRRLQDMLARATDDYMQVAATLGGAEPTLVHNDCAAKNILVDRRTDPPTVSIVDWEMAGLGCGAIDLALLTAGLEGDDRVLLERAYADARTEAAQQPQDECVNRRELEAARAHRLIVLLWRSPGWDKTEEELASWIRELGDHVGAVKRLRCG